MWKFAFQNAPLLRKWHSTVTVLNCVSIVFVCFLFEFFCLKLALSLNDSPQHFKTHLFYPNVPFQSAKVSNFKKFALKIMKVFSHLNGYQNYELCRLKKIKFKYFFKHRPRIRFFLFFEKRCQNCEFARAKKGLSRFIGVALALS